MKKVTLAAIALVLAVLVTTAAFPQSPARLKLEATLLTDSEWQLFHLVRDKLEDSQAFRFNADGTVTEMHGFKRWQLQHGRLVVIHGEKRERWLALQYDSRRQLLYACRSGSSAVLVITATGFDAFEYAQKICPPPPERIAS